MLTFRFIILFLVTTEMGLHASVLKITKAHPPEYSVCSDWSVLTRLTQHSSQQQRSCAESILIKLACRHSTMQMYFQEKCFLWERRASVVFHFYNRLHALERTVYKTLREMKKQNGSLLIFIIIFL